GMYLSRSLLVSPASQRRLQRCIEEGIGFALRHAPLAYWKKSSHGAADRSMSESSTPFRVSGAGLSADFCEAQARTGKSRASLRMGTDLNGGARTTFQIGQRGCRRDQRSPPSASSKRCFMSP